MRVKSEEEALELQIMDTEEQSPGRVIKYEVFSVETEQLMFLLFVLLHNRDH